MRSPRIGQALDQIEAKLQADGLSLPHQRGMTVGEARRAAGFGSPVGARHAVPRQIGVELERSPGYAWRVLRPGRQRQLESPLAEVAPRANRVRKYVYSRAHCRGIVPCPLYPLV